MQKASEIVRLLGFMLAFIALNAMLCFGLGCQRTMSSQDAPVNTQQGTLGQTDILQIQFFPAQSLNARPVHARAAGTSDGVVPGPLGRNWADVANFQGATFYFNVSVTSAGADTASESRGAPTTGPVDQSPNQDNRLALPVAVGPNPRASATVADEAAGDTTTGGEAQPSPERTPEPPAVDPPADEPMTLRQREQIMLALLAMSKRQ